MVLMAIVGELGGGKTLALTYLAWNNYYYKKRQVWSNYNLYGIPFRPVRSIDDLREMIPMRTLTADELIKRKEIFFVGDELWRWVDSRCVLMDMTQSKTRRIKNKIITDILAASRKAFVTIAYSTQSFSQVDKRIREVTDFVCYPMIMGGNFMCRVSVFKGNRPTVGSMMPDIRFYAEPVFAMYNTYEVVDELTEGTVSKEVCFPVTANPAWIKYLKDKGYDDKKILEESENIEKMIRRPDDTPKGKTASPQNR